MPQKQTTAEQMKNDLNQEQQQDNGSSEQEHVDYGSEAEDILDAEQERDGEDRDWWTPTPGTHKIKVLGEATTETRPWGDNDEDIDIAVIPVKVGGEELYWSMRKGTTANSRWGQLVAYAQHNDGLKGAELTVIRQGKKPKNTSYTIVEAADYDLEGDAQ